ncbi:hypothetical protein [Pseudomonas sp. GL-R-19]|uniref:hypothetical protein n=1 Tax=Pseudomonas sp. GL-R-19 TaxID=2832391 RepID=UPI001CC15869|nr:hypothetical protein [Pseudomonas sp. GL-R-19]
MKSITAIIEWFGPYDFAGAKEAMAKDYGDGLYMFVGKLGGESRSKLQYVGIAKNLRSRLNARHPILAQFLAEHPSYKGLWLGEVVSPRTPGKKLKATDQMLDLAEWAHAYFLQLPLNTQKRKTPPERPIVVYNRWWKTDYQTPHSVRPNGAWPDLIDWVGEDYPVKLAWFGGKFINKHAEEFKTPNP